MSKSPILTNYVSEIDQLLQKLDKEYPQPSYSQRKERNKSLRITQLRDTIEQAEKSKSLWEGF